MEMNPVYRRMNEEHTADSEDIVNVNKKTNIKKQSKGTWCVIVIVTIAAVLAVMLSVGNVIIMMHAMDLEPDNTPKQTIEALHFTVLNSNKTLQAFQLQLNTLDLRMQKLQLQTSQNIEPLKMEMENSEKMIAALQTETDQLESLLEMTNSSFNLEVSQIKTTRNSGFQGLRQMVRNIQQTLTAQQELIDLIKQGTELNPAYNCEELPQSYQSDNYWIRTDAPPGKKIQYCHK